MSGCVIRCERPKKNVGADFFFGVVEKKYLAVKHHNEAAPKKKKKPRFVRLGAEKHDFTAPKEQRPRKKGKSKLW